MIITEIRGVIDSVRLDTQRLWRRLPIEEKKRFMRHMRAWWEVHRHRMAPSIAARASRLLPLANAWGR